MRNLDTLLMASMLALLLHCQIYDSTALDHTGASLDLTEVLAPRPPLKCYLYLGLGYVP